MKRSTTVRLFRAAAIVATVAGFVTYSADNAIAGPSEAELRSSLLTPAEVARATKTQQLKEKAIECHAPYGCDRVLTYMLTYDKSYGDRQPAHFNIWDMGSVEAAQRWVRASGANPLQNTEAVVLTPEVYTDWLPPRNGWGLSQSVQWHGQWIVTASCYGHTRETATACVNDLRSAQLAKLIKRKFVAP